MTRLWLVASALAAAIVAAALLLAQRGSAPALPPPHGISVQTSIDSDTIGFADRVVARVVVQVDRRRVHAAALKVQESFFPFTPLAPTRTVRAVQGRTLVVSTDTPIACLQEQCLPVRNNLIVRLPTVEVHAPRVGGGELNASEQWPEISIGRRVSDVDLAARPLPFRRDLTPPPSGFALGPGWVAAGLDAAALLLAAGGVALAAFTLGGVLGRRGRRRAPLGELDRALALALDARGRPPADRRKALGLLADLLAERDDRLAGTAEQLAWSRPVPTADALAELVSTAEQAVNGR